MEEKGDLNERYMAGKRVALYGIVINVLLLILKLAAGYSSASRAMIADGFNSVGDVFASVVTLLGSLIAARPRDMEHVWGHGKAEYIAGMAIGFSMIAIAVYTIGESAGSLAAGEKPAFSYPLAGVAVATICIKAALFAYVRKEAKLHDSLLIGANAQDHRNDIFVTTGTLAAILLSLAGVYWADGAAGIAISCWIIYSGYTILRDASRVLMDSNADADQLEAYRNNILQLKGIDHVDSVVSNPVGAKRILIVKISVDRSMTVMESHTIAKDVERRLMRDWPDIDDVIVHINPDLPHTGHTPQP
jgi:cation diffusion facilitator family transporter